MKSGCVSGTSGNLCVSVMDQLRNDICASYKRRRLSSKASAQAHRNKVCNRNRRKRRDALGKLNQLTTDLDLPLPKLNVRLPGLPPGMTKVLRTLNKRCVGEEDAKRFEEAVRAWTTSGGALPDGMTLTDAGRVVCASDEPDPSLVPRHKLLKVFAYSQLRSC